MPILISADGISFAPAPNASSQTYGGVGYDGSNYVAVGNGGLLRTSTNSTDWVQRTSNTGQNLTRICRGPNHWVAVGGNGAIITSTSTLAWTLRSSGTANVLRGVAFGNGSYVAVGDGGTIVTSSDAVNWDVQFSGTTTNLLAVAFANGQFVAVGNLGTILTSANGVEWQPSTSGVNVALSGIAYGYGRYVTVGDAMLQSTNGVDWENITLKIPSAEGMRSVAYLDQSFWVTGDGGSLLQSDSTDGIPRVAGSILPGNAGFQLKLTLNAPSSYRVLAATNLNSASWVEIANITNSLPPHIWTDSNAVASPVKFYRIVSP